MVQFGWIKDKWNDRAVYHLPKVALQLWVDYANYLPSVRDQMDVGACTGFGIGAEHFAVPAPVPEPVPKPEPAECCPVVKLLRKMRAQRKAVEPC